MIIKFPTKQSGDDSNVMEPDQICKTMHEANHLAFLCIV